MNVERIRAIPLDKKQGERYAAEAAEQALGLNVKKIRYLGGGSFGRAYGAEFYGGQKIVVKFLRAENMLEKEAHDLRLLAAHCPIKMPKVLFTRRADKDIPVDCYGMERIEGKNAIFSLGLLLQSKRKRLAFAEKATAALHAIHACRSDRFGDTLAPESASWTDFYKPFAKAVLDRAEELLRGGELSEKIVQTMRAAWDKFDVIFSEKVEEACLIHGDLNVANVMVGKKGEITGFIDPLNSMYADREYDLFQFDNLTGKRFFLRETYTRKYGASRYCDAKCAFYGLWNEVYCYIRSGVLVGLIMNPLVKNMRARLAKL